MKTKEQIREYQKEWREKNKEKIRAYAKEYGPKWFQENKKRLNKVRQEWRDNNIEKSREYGRKSYINNIKKYKERELNRKIKFPEKRKAVTAVMHAVESGKITKPNICHNGCEDKRYRIEAHHPDYSKPLEVIWLCSRCHHNLHKELKNANNKT